MRFALSQHKNNRSCSASVYRLPPLPCVPLPSVLVARFHIIACVWVVPSVETYGEDTREGLPPLLVACLLAQHTMQYLIERPTQGISMATRTPRSPKSASFDHVVSLDGAMGLRGHVLSRGMVSE